ncbi:hypothetical protein LY76DRAFT_214574 [Colletotrichum caudatum]|nr:hypothetical protein LY76DRAFT_214574 [Colletotrichum caudatum]
MTDAALGDWSGARSEVSAVAGDQCRIVFCSASDKNRRNGSRLRASMGTLQQTQPSRLIETPRSGSKCSLSIYLSLSLPLSRQIRKPLQRFWLL